MPVSFLRLERYEYDVPGHGVLIWDIDRAKAEVAAGHILATVELPRDEQHNVLTRCQWDPARADRVDITIPGIAAPFVWEQKVIYVPIDGIHRIARAYTLERPFYMHLLTDAASRAAFVSGPGQLMPWTHLVEEPHARR